MLTVKILTPSRVEYNGQVRSITLPTESGVITVLPGHVDLISSIRGGVMHMRGIDEFETEKKDYVIDQDDYSRVAPDQDFSLWRGVVKVKTISGKTEVIVMVDSIVDVRSLDEEKLNQAIINAKLAMEDENLGDFNPYLDHMSRDLSRLKIARKLK